MQEVELFNIETQLRIYDGTQLSVNADFYIENEDAFKILVDRENFAESELEKIAQQIYRGLRQVLGLNPEIELAEGVEIEDKLGLLKPGSKECSDGEV